MTRVGVRKKTTSLSGGKITQVAGRPLAKANSTGGEVVRPHDYEVIIIGSGPAGSSAAELLAAGGKKVAVVEAEALGGECLNYGCIPTKSMLSAAHSFASAKENKAISNHGLLKLKLSRVVKHAESKVIKTGARNLDKQFEKMGIALLKGRAYFIDSKTIDVAGRQFRAKNFIIASGGDVFIPNIPGLDGMEYLTYKNFIPRVKERAPRTVLIIGGGAVGCEYAQIINACGIKVAIVEKASRLVSDLEAESSVVLQKALENDGIRVYTNTRIVGVQNSHGSNNSSSKEMYMIVDETNPNKPGRKVKLRGDAVMVATGKKMREGDGLGNAGLHCENGLIHINDNCQTNVDGIYAIGDAAGPYRLTSTAIAQAKVAAEHIIAKNRKGPSSAGSLLIVARSLFTNPEVASVGISTVELKKEQIPFDQSLVELSEVAKSGIDNGMGGFVKLWGNKKTGQIYGACLVGPHASEQIPLLALAIKMKIKASDVAEMGYVFPTWSEAIALAASEM